MFERFTDTARYVVVQAQHAARRLGHNYIGCEHLLLAAAATGEPPAQSCATRASRPNVSRPEYCVPSGVARPPTRWAASTEKHWLPSASTSTSSAPGSR